MTNPNLLRRRIRLCAWIMIIGLVLSGATAIPLQTQADWAARVLGVEQTTSVQASSPLTGWLLKVREGLRDVNQRYPFMAYGTDWLAFGHFVIAIAFIGVLRDPVRNLWLFDFGLIACALIIPYALAFGAVRGIPFWWRMIDCSFGIVGALPLWLGRRYTRQLEQISTP
jgi:hypothetical protein